MEEPGAGTFAKLLRRLIDDGVIRTDDSVLVQFAGAFDEAVCAEVGLTDCSFSNIAPDTHSTGHTSAVQFDAHRMPQPHGSFDHVMGHSGLHHCSRPHEALHEMYRLARKTVIFVENQDSPMMRVATRAGVVAWHELPAVIDGEYKSGGVDGTGVPNFVYRWTRREVRKVVAAFDPAYDVPIDFHSEWNLGSGRVSAELLQRKLRLSNEHAQRGFGWAHRVLNAAVPGQGNIFAAIIRKDLARLHRWMESPTEMKRI
jgi:SAM-dependent methyltransferase